MDFLGMRLEGERDSSMQHRIAEGARFSSMRAALCSGAVSFKTPADLTVGLRRSAPQRSHHEARGGNPHSECRTEESTPVSREPR